MVVDVRGDFASVWARFERARRSRRRGVVRRSNGQDAQRRPERGPGSGPVVRRAFAYLVVVGAVLVGINHGDAIVRGDFDGPRLAKMLLTPVVPYVVSTLSSVSAIRAQARERRAG